MGQLDTTVKATIANSRQNHLLRQEANINQNPVPYEIGDLIVSYLYQIGVRYVFGVTGGAIEPFYNALGRSQKLGEITPVVARHEAGAAFMAEGYSRNSGLLGVCCSTTGPGATNLITGVASAYEGNIPMLVITAQTAISTFGKKPLQESDDTGVNTVGMFQYCTKYNSLVSHADQLEQKLVTAIMTALNENGPAHLSIPLDIMRSPAKNSAPFYELPRLIKKVEVYDSESVNQLYQMLTESKKTVFIIGSDCNEAISLILKAAIHLNADIVTTPDGKGLVNPNHPLFKGVISFAGHKSAETALLQTDVDSVVAIGTNMGEWASNGWDKATVLNNKLIHVEPTISHFTRSPMAKLHVPGNISTIFSRIANRLETGFPQTRKAIKPTTKAKTTNKTRLSNIELHEEIKCLDTSTPIKPQWLMSNLVQAFPPNTKYLSDIGNSLAWTIHYLHPFDRRLSGRRVQSRKDGSERRGETSLLYQSGFEFAPMGWAIGNSVGVSLAAPENPIVCIVGDGALLMSGQEITVAQEYNLPIIYLVMNDSSLGMVKHGQRLANAENVGNKLPDIDFKKFAESMGIRAFSIKEPNDLEKLNVAELLKQGGPTLLDVKIDPDETPPMAIRMKVLGSAQ